ncbi:hypothetical protein Bca4012_065842 [Brassica carinata]|uniref:Uncharacterized protein n=1 Tax=Brassica carinata TaxID=52824 RepID=A0A8X7VPE3_BRACI|nr:hypothetical protein Bca52824_018163 [Brassica carinata]
MPRSSLANVTSVTRRNSRCSAPDLTCSFITCHSSNETAANFQLRHSSSQLSSNQWRRRLLSQHVMTTKLRAHAFTRTWRRRFISLPLAAICRSQARAEGRRTFKLCFKKTTS